jgi:adenylate kinase
MSCRIVLLGPPGSGKGTQAPRLARELGVLQIATGDLLRQAVKNETELGKQAKGFLDRGELVPDELVVGLIEEQLKALNGQKGFVLDGFPRNPSQARALEGITRIDLAVLVNVPRDEVVRRLSARRVCSKCGQIYNLEFKPPKQSGICDVCQSNLVQRSDDKPDVVAKRYDVQYNEQAAPLIESYRKASVLVEVDGQGSIESVFERILREIQARKSAKKR